MDFSCFLLALILSSLLVEPEPVQAGSRKALAAEHHRHTASGVGFRVELRYVDHGKNLSSFHRLQRAVTRAKHRLEKLSVVGVAKANTESNDIKSQIHPGNGEFLIELSIGSPPLPYSAIIDTGSDLIWTQCQPCLQCYSQPSPIYNPHNSTSFHALPCDSDLCSSLPSSSCDSDSSSCSYSYGYGDYSSTSGILASETFTFSDSISVPHIAFGCGDDNEGSGFDQGGGLVGLGRGPLSLVSQLDEPKFSYCLTAPNSDTTSILLMGSLADVTNQREESGSVVVTPLLKNPAQPSFYYLNLEGISVGGTRLGIPESTFAVNDDGSGGMIIDSGTTITYLEEKAFEGLKREFVKKTAMKVSKDGSEKTGLDLCFELPDGESEVDVPALVFHFEKADLELPAENFMIGDETEGLICLAMGGASGMSILGNVQQQNKLVLYDLEKETISFAGLHCKDL